jgi:hypothetical protein
MRVAEVRHLRYAILSNSIRRQHWCGDLDIKRPGSTLMLCKASEIPQSEVFRKARASTSLFACIVMMPNPRAKGVLCTSFLRRLIEFIYGYLP